MRISESTYEEKKRLLLKKMEEYAGEEMLVAFSGGVDSSLLLKLACEATERRRSKSGKEKETGGTAKGKRLQGAVYAVTVHSRLHPAEDLAIAAKVAKETGAVHRVIEADELKEAQICDNPKDRCYRCKKYLFGKIQQMAEELGISRILEGTNEDDLHVYRPGIRAVRELGILSPLAECKMTKAEVRRLAKEYGISVAKRPAGPCLATRFPYGTRLTYEKMAAVDRGEQFIKSLGFENVRLRVHGELARIEVAEADLERLLFVKKDVISFLKKLDFVYVTLDLEGFRSGSMDVGLQGEVQKGVKTDDHCGSEQKI